MSSSQEFPNRADADLLARIFPGDSEMARRMRGFDWSHASLGPPESWPQNLRIALGICLSSRFPLLVCWGPSLTLFYNDAYIPLLEADKHPAMLGRPAREAWSEIWDRIGPMIETVHTTGDPCQSDDIPISTATDQFVEAPPFVSFSFSPIFGKDGQVDGLCCTCSKSKEKPVAKHPFGCAQEEQAVAAAHQPSAAILAHIPPAASMTATPDKPCSAREEVAGVETQLLKLSARRQLAAENAALVQLHEVSARLVSEEALPTLLQAAVDAVVTVSGATMGTLQLYDKATRSLYLAAYQGFQQPSLDHFRTVCDSCAASCGAASIRGERVIVEDISQCPILRDTSNISAMAAEGVVACLTTPLWARDGTLLGMFSTHWKEKHRPDASTLRILDLLAREAADLIEHRQHEAALLESEACLADEAETLVRLNLASSRLWRIQSLQEGLDEMLAATIELLGADMGNVQILDSQRGILTIAAQRGFDHDFLEFFREVSVEDDSACGRTLRTGTRTVIEDVEIDPPYVPLRAIARAAGYRAVQSTPLLSSDGTPLGMLSTHFRSPHRPSEQDLRRLDLYARQAADFIERCRADATLRASQARLFETQQRLQALMQAVPVGISFSDDPSCQRITGNPTVLTQFEVKPEDNLSASAPDSVAPGRQVRYFRDGQEISAIELPMQRAVAENRAIAPMELEVILPSGRRWFTEASGAPIHNAEGQIIGGVAVTVDITERKRAEQALLESEARFQSMADSAPVLLWISGADKQCTYFNKPWLEFTGRTMEQELGFGWADSVHPDDLDRCIEIYTGNFDVHRSFTMEYRLRRHDGEFRWVMDTGIPFYGPGEKFMGYIGSCVDISERRQMEEALREADRRKDEFLAILAHELRNPLAPLRNALHLLRLTGSDRQAVERTYTMMERQINNLVRLVDDLMEVSRISRGKIELKLENVELASVIKTAIETSQPLIDSIGHRLTVSLPTESLVLNADTVRLTQVFANLLNNAAKYSGPGGEIRLTARRENNCAVISVQDNGVGISADALPHVFDLFTQIDRSAGRAQGGLGIGLALARDLVELHGGNITGHSAGPGQGSEFIVHLPLAAVYPLNSVPPIQPYNLQSQQRILVVDDNRDAADSLGVLLRFSGAEICVVYDGVAALEALDIFKPAVVLLDLGMPVMDGYEVARRIRRSPEGQNLTLIALTGWGQDEDRRNSRAAGFDHHLTKPVDIDALQVLLTSPESQPLVDS